ncbi:thioredoxin [Lyticum sinuosum]|uniref:Thioredoxin n=1 Tax=Lyticum sinuosum TaxID=1332059 RepID=A0AAE4VME0_9RICK|nr:thioredoxin [Lyticum sinuosum]MDZ5761394.1 Thioredoxin-1 [Lyticum sinuosum]
METAHLINITDSSFENEVLKYKGFVLVDFWAEWCGPCKQLMPILESFAEKNNDKIKICKLNVDDNQKIPGEMGIRGIPTLILFKNGEKISIKVGALSLKDLESWIEENMSNN